MKLWVLLIWMGDGLGNGGHVLIDSLKSHEACQEAAVAVAKTFRDKRPKMLCLEVVKA